MDANDRSARRCAEPRPSLDEAELVDELTAGFAAGYIRHKARQLVGKAGLTASDRPDLEQDMVLALYVRFPKFDPARAHWKAFVVTVIERFVATLLESRRTRKRQSQRPTTSLSTPCKAPNGWRSELAQLVEPRHLKAVTCQAHREPRDLADLQADVATVVASLPSHARWLCEHLKYDSISEVARRDRVSRTTMHQRIRRLRLAFRRAGLEPPRNSSPKANGTQR